MIVWPAVGLRAQEAASEFDELTAGRIDAVQGLGRKFSSLAAEVPESLHDWRPMEGVRSFREVFALIAAEWSWFPKTWVGGEMEHGGSFGEVVAHMEGLAWPDLVEALEDGAGRYADAVRAADGPAGARTVSLFGAREVPAHTALALLQFDQHEHLGQAIAYARMNGIVPPWSRDDR